MATKRKKVFVKLRCATCKDTNYFTRKSKTLTSEGKKLDLKKFCASCRKHVKHAESKK
ncbi:MAG: 50S ribosomal protein L33 [bacterium]|nr:50S ribosomal protein L33 [bacterium]